MSLPNRCLCVLAQAFRVEKRIFTEGGFEGIFYILQLVDDLAETAFQIGCMGARHAKVS